MLTVDLCEASITKIDPALLEFSPKNTCAGINNFLGAGVFGSCTKMFYRGMPVAVKRFLLCINRRCEKGSPDNDDPAAPKQSMPIRNFKIIIS